jgi:hypothetical protein
MIESFIQNQWNISTISILNESGKLMNPVIVTIIQLAFHLSEALTYLKNQTIEILSALILNIGHFPISLSDALEYFKNQQIW